MSSEQLAACPFCGRSGLLNETHKNHFRIVCEFCGLQGATHADHADPTAAIKAAADAWDTRVTAPTRLPDGTAVGGEACVFMGIRACGERSLTCKSPAKA